MTAENKTKKLTASGAAQAKTSNAGLKMLGAGWLPKLQTAFEALDCAALLGSHVNQAQLVKFLDLIADWNQRTDLTAARSADELVDLVVADAAVLAREEARAPSLALAAQPSWLDIGSGMGAPGFPLALFLPESSLRLVEPRQKRVAFLRTAQGSLELPHIHVERSRSDALASQSADIAVSRATFAPQAWLAEGARLARAAVWVLLANDAAPILAGWREQLSVDYRWPLTDVERRAVRYVPNARI